jgi:hypothetical protein
LRLPMVPFTLTIPSSYLMGHYNYPSMTKNRKKKPKHRFLDLSLQKPSFHTKMHIMGKRNVQPSHEITHIALDPHNPTKMTHRSSWPLIYDQK